MQRIHHKTEDHYTSGKGGGKADATRNPPSIGCADKHVSHVRLTEKMGAEGGAKLATDKIKKEKANTGKTHIVITRGSDLIPHDVLKFTLTLSF